MVLFVCSPPQPQHISASNGVLTSVNGAATPVELKCFSHIRRADVACLVLQVTIIADNCTMVQF